MPQWAVLSREKWLMLVTLQTGWFQHGLWVRRYRLAAPTNLLCFKLASAAGLITCGKPLRFLITCSSLMSQRALFYWLNAQALSEQDSWRAVTIAGTCRTKSRPIQEDPPLRVEGLAVWCLGKLGKQIGNEKYHCQTCWQVPRPAFWPVVRFSWSSHYLLSGFGDTEKRASQSCVLANPYSAAGKEKS